MLLDRPIIGPGRGGAGVGRPEVGGHPSRDLPIGHGVEQGVLAAELVVDVELGVPGGEGAEPVEVPVVQPELAQGVTVAASNAS